MDGSEMRKRATEVASKAGVRDEEAIATHEGAAGKMGAAGDLIGLTLPGAESLRGKSRRIVLVTDQTVRLFEGARFGKIGAQLGAYPVAQDVLAYDDRQLIFPDGQSVVLTAYQARQLIAATGGVLNYARANYALRRAGVEGESGLGTATGDVPGSVHRTAGNVVADLVAGDGGLTSRTSEKRLVLLTDKNARLFAGDAVHELGSPIGVYPVGTRVEVTERTVTFPDGSAVEFKASETATKVADVVARGRDAIE
jgi:hypothetical protein